jgi:hypothetical protein
MGAVGSSALPVAEEDARPVTRRARREYAPEHEGAAMATMDEVIALRQHDELEPMIETVDYAFKAFIGYEIDAAMSTYSHDTAWPDVYMQAYQTVGARVAHEYWSASGGLRNAFAALFEAMRADPDFHEQLVAMGPVERAYADESNVTSVTQALDTAATEWRFKTFFNDWRSPWHGYTQVHAAWAAHADSGAVPSHFYPDLKFAHLEPYV